MDFSSILTIIALFFCTLIFIAQIIIIVKLVRKCSKEGVKAVKFQFNVGSAFLIAAVIFTVVSAGYWFINAAEANENIVFFEGIKGTELVDVFAEKQEQEQGIKIIDPEEYYLQTLEEAKSTAESYTWRGVIFTYLSIYGILKLIGMLYIITGKGFRSCHVKEAIPIFAAYDKQNGKIIIMKGNAEKLFTVAANPKNLASLGQFIVRDEEQTIQEETL